jgi:putative transposase
MKKKGTLTRLEGFDYTTDQLYFVTFNVEKRAQYFGKVIDKKMILSDPGRIARDRFHWLVDQYPYVVLHEFVVMPDHVHAIIEINKGKLKKSYREQPEGSRRDASEVPLEASPVKIKPLGQLIGAYKTTVSRQIRLLGYSTFTWQSSFHDRIIRNQVEYHYISEYIKANPANWNPCYSSLPDPFKLRDK